jgi:hypothetical protein
MRRSAFLLSLLAALTGTPLRQAEAAADLSRLLADSSQADFQVPDGGVGDDSGVGTLAASHGHASDLAADVVLFFLVPPSTFVATPAADEGLWERVWWPQSPPALRFAWLQTFRF